MAKKIFVVILALMLALGAAACGSDGGGVAVQRADQLAAAGQAGERYAGMVVSENVVEIRRDSTKTIEELYVSVGQKVAEGDKLFTYDSAALELDLEKAQLEIEKMTNEQTDYAQQLEKLEKQLKNTYSDSAKVRLTLEINTLKTEQMENDYQLAAKEAEEEELKQMLENIDITAPVEGTIRKIDESGESGGAYITIQQSGAYRIKGNINEMSMGNGLMVGSRVKIYSRVSDETWMGTVASIDTENPVEDNSNVYYDGSSDTMTSTSKYPFYVDLDSTEGLLLGQHVYMEVSADVEMEGLWIPENYLVDMGYDEETGESTATVFADNGKGKLERRDVTLGMYDGMTGCYEVLSGLAAEDYVADPTAPGCESGAAVSRRDADDFEVEIVTPTSGAAEDEAAGEFSDEMAGELIIDEVIAEPTGEVLDEPAGELADTPADEPTGETEG